MLRRFLVVFLAMCGSLTAVEPERLQRAQAEIPESRLLNVNIHLFDPGVPPEDPGALEKKGVFEEVRKAEGRYIPVRLMETLQSTGLWGSVRIVPDSATGGELNVSGVILKSNGFLLSVRVRVQDATGKRWFERKYKERANALAYRDKDDGLGERLPFQNLYNRIANDLLETRQRRKDQKLQNVRDIAQLTFARDFVPDAFSDYLHQKRNGRLKLKKLPSEDDPMMSRVDLVRERDLMFIDTLTEHYVNFQAQMGEAYHNWRKFSYEEEKALRDARRAARTQQILGALLIVGGILAEGDSDAAAVGRQAAVIGGNIALQSGIAKNQELKIHREALKELAASFDAEVEPILVQVEGQTRKLTGSVETQYAQWRALLTEMFHTETGTPIDPNATAVTSPNGSQ